MHEDPPKSYMKNQSVTLTDQNSQDESQFCQEMQEKVEIITRTLAELCPSDSSLRFLT